MRIGRKSAAGLQFAPKIFQLLRAKPSFHERPRINPWRCVALKINRVAFEFRGTRAKKMIESHFVQRRRRSVGRNMPADIVFFSICPHRSEEHTSELQSLAYLV